MPENQCNEKSGSSSTRKSKTAPKGSTPTKEELKKGRTEETTEVDLDQDDKQPHSSFVTLEDLAKFQFDMQFTVTQAIQQGIGQMHALVEKGQSETKNEMDKIRLDMVKGLTKEREDRMAWQKEWEGKMSEF
eukprot:116183-Karenia_brevis.AAC.1